MIKEKVKLSYIIMFVGYLSIFLVLDYLNMDYKQMNNEYGIWLVIVNVAFNIIMSLLSTYLFYLSSKNISKAKKSYFGKNMSEIAVLFGILTYGCTPCVISFFAALSIPFAVITLPFAGLPYKVVSLLLIIFGILLVNHESKKSACSIKTGG